MSPQEKLLDKLAKIQAHAESAEKIGNEAEAEAFAAMLQQLCLKHKIAMSDIQFAELDKDEPVSRYRMDYRGVQGTPGLPLKRARCAWQEALASVVAAAHFCRILVRSGSNIVTLVGRKSDCAVAEYTFMVLARAIFKLSNKAYDQYYYQCEKTGETFRAAGYKRSFIDAFVNRLQQRFDEERQTTESTSSTALVRVKKSDAAVVKYMHDHYRGPGAEYLGGNNKLNAEGLRDGVAAANRVNLKGKAVGSGNQSKQLR